MKDKMTVALRVLTSLQYGTHPVQADIESLRDWVDPRDQDAPYEEMACIVIHAEMLRRKKGRIMQRAYQVDNTTSPPGESAPS